jgi:hypothetical protein
MPDDIIQAVDKQIRHSDLLIQEFNIMIRRLDKKVQILGEKVQILDKNIPTLDFLINIYQSGEPRQQRMNVNLAVFTDHFYINP